MKRRFGPNGQKDDAGADTASLPDLIFTLLFFFMIVTNMREAPLKVEFKVPQATELERLEKKSLVTYIYVEGRLRTCGTSWATKAAYN